MKVSEVKALSLSLKRERERESCARDVPGARTLAPGATPAGSVMTASSWSVKPASKWLDWIKCAVLIGVAAPRQKQFGCGVVFEG